MDVRYYERIRRETERWKPVYKARGNELDLSSMEIEGEAHGLADERDRTEERRASVCGRQSTTVIRALWLILSALLLTGVALGFLDAEALERLRPVLTALAQREQLPDAMTLKTGGNVTVDVRLKSPFTALLVGPTGCGKTRLMFEMIEHRNKVCTEPPAEIIYCYGAWQSKFEEWKDEVVFHEGFLDPGTEIPSDGLARWLIVDDLLEEVTGKESLNNSFTKHSHHKNLSVFFLTQNVFRKGTRTVSLNTHYMFLFKNPRDKQTVDNLAKQAFPGHVAGVRRAYELATEEPHSFLRVDMTQTTPDKARLLGNFLHPIKAMEIYDVTG